MFFRFFQEIICVKYKDIQCKPRRYMIFNIKVFLHFMKKTYHEKTRFYELLMIKLVFSRTIFTFTV